MGSQSAGFDGDRRAEQGDEEWIGVEVLLVAGRQQAGQDLLGVGATPGAIAATDD
jgi:hypothetical protein